MKRPKYGNRKTLLDGLEFDSKKESERWRELSLLQSGGHITDLSRQVRMPLRVNGMLVCTIVPDFTYVEAGQHVIEDVKSPITAKNRAYRIKLKLLKALTGADIRET